jgi:hypothetical protein
MRQKMFATLPSPSMAKDARKKTVKDDGTKQIRVFDDLADMIGWIIKLEGGTVAKLIDPILRPEIVAKYARYEKQVEQLKKAASQLPKV